MIQACTYHSAKFVKPHQRPTPSEPTAIHCVRKLVSCVTHPQSRAKVDTWNKKEKPTHCCQDQNSKPLKLKTTKTFFKNPRLLKLKTTKIQHNRNPSTKHSHNTAQRTQTATATRHHLTKNKLWQNKLIALGVAPRLRRPRGLQQTATCSGESLARQLSE